MYINLINRDLSAVIRQSFDVFPVVTLTGPRQSGKTTLSRSMYPELPYVNLEDSTALLQLQTDAKAFFDRFPCGLIIDEAQNHPQVFSNIQVLVDEDRFNNRTNRKFIVTGSSNFALLEKVTQSLAGRTAVLTLLPFSYNELALADLVVSTDQIILNGGFPEVWRQPNSRSIILSNYITTYIERDVRNLVNIKELRSFQLFLRLCASRIGTEFNASSLSVATGVSVNTIQSWLSVLCASYVVHLLQPFSANISKRLIKTPKLYFYDTGLASYLLGIETEQQLQFHPLRGQLFENMIVNNLIKNGLNKGKNEMLFFYRDKGQHEVDILRQRGMQLEVFEIKAAKSYNTEYFKQLHYLQSILGSQIERSAVIYDGDEELDKQHDGFYNFRNFLLDS